MKDSDRSRDSSKNETHLLPATKTKGSNHPRDSQLILATKQEVSDRLRDSPPLGSDSAAAILSEPWTHAYRPRCSNDVIGNRAPVVKLRDWLGSWREKCLSSDTRERPVRTEGGKRERRKEEGRGRRRKEERGDEGGRQSTESKTQASFLSSDDDDDDFLAIRHLRRKCGSARFHDDGSSGVSDAEEGEGPRPVALLCGDHGCGKTAAMYACAQELGFKVRH